MQQETHGKCVITSSSPFVVRPFHASELHLARTFYSHSETPYSTRTRTLQYHDHVGTPTT